MKTDLNQTTRKTRRNRGFSILELLLVLVILAILAGIVGVNFIGKSADAKIKAARTQLENIKQALTTYEIDTGTLPTTQQGLEALSENPGNVEGWTGPYMEEKLPKDQWGKEWQYRYPGTHNNFFDLYSAGPDGIEGNDDDIKNWSDED